MVDKMDNLERLENKVDTISEKVHSIDNRVLKNTISLDEHMRRTELNEEKLSIFEDKIIPALDAYKFVALCFKIVVPITTIVAICFKYFSN